MWLRSAAGTRALWWLVGSVPALGAYLFLTGGVAAGHLEVAYPVGTFAAFTLFETLLLGFTVLERAVSLPKLLLPWAALALAFGAFRINFWTSSGERAPGVPFVLGPRTAAPPPVALVPDPAACALLGPTRHCPNRRRYGYANPQVFGQHSLAEADAAFEAVVAATDLAIDLAHNAMMYTGTADDKRACRDTTIQALCELAFPRCTATCVRTQPCLGKYEQPARALSLHQLDAAPFPGALD